MNLLLKAVGGISDEHITEFACVQPRKKRVPLWFKIVSAAACLGLMIAVVPLIRGLVYDLDPVNNSSSDTHLDPVGSSNNSDPVNNSSSDNNLNGLQPHLFFNDRQYILDPVLEPCDDLPEGYVFVGEITSEDRNNKKVNGYGEMLRIGNKIYQHPDFSGDVYVYTTLFTGGERYWYLRFVDWETVKREAEERGESVYW